MLFRDRPVARFKAIEGPARRKLLYLHGAKTLQDLAIPPGNQREALKRNRAGQHGIRINDQWRVCFRWRESDAYDVEIVDYHGSLDEERTGRTTRRPLCPRNCWNPFARE